MKIKTKLFNSFTVNGPRLYNLLPVDLRDMINEPTETFKRKLDAFIENIPDHPQVPGYKPFCQTESNSLTEMIPHYRKRAAHTETLSKRNKGESTISP